MSIRQFTTCIALPFLLVAGSALGKATTTAYLEPKIGFDTNPLAVGGSAGKLLGEQDTLTTTIGFAGSFTVSGDGPVKSALKLSYAGDSTEFREYRKEDYLAHKLAAVGSLATGTWTINAETNLVFVDGNREGLSSTSAINANGISVWRERRRQVQLREKLLIQREEGQLVLRGSTSYLGYHYMTKVTAGRFAFADRSDLVGGLDAGWRQSKTSLWLTGVRWGWQNQEQIPLPNCEFDYSSTYQRVVAGWEGKCFEKVSLSLLAGPDFRRFFGAVDTKSFGHDRDRTSLWFEAALSASLSPSLKVTAKATRMSWLSSTGKSALIDSCEDAAAAWTVNKTWSVRATGKLHRCEYFPSNRDDAELLIGAGVSWKATSHVQLSFDAFSHRGKNMLGDLPERTFTRAFFNLGANIAF